jgi:hypothetical protein
MRRRCGYTSPVSLFDKHNKDATPKGAAGATLVGAIAGPAVMWVYVGVIGDPDIRSAGFAAFSAIVGALFAFGVYWQGWPD